MDIPEAILTVAAEVNNVLRDARGRVDLNKSDLVLVPTTCVGASDLPPRALGSNS